MRSGHQSGHFDRRELATFVMDKDSAAWWQNATIYEIATISFQDSDGDGYGDLRGLLRRLDYLKWLGIDAVWLTPIYRSPDQDFGYDISDFCAVDPRYGSIIKNANIKVE